MATREQVRQQLALRLDGLLLDARGLARHDAPHPSARGDAWAGSRRAGTTPRGAQTGSSTSWTSANHLFLPVLALTLGYIGEYAIIMRASLLEMMGEDFVQTARAKGVHDRLVRKPPRGAERDPADVHARLPELRVRARRRDHRRVGLLLARARPAQLRGDQRARLPGAAGGVPDRERLRHPVQPGRRPALRLPRPSDPGRHDDRDRTTSRHRRRPTPRQSAGKLKWTRRRRARDGLLEALQAQPAGHDRPDRADVLHRPRHLRAVAHRPGAAGPARPRPVRSWRRRPGPTRWGPTTSVARSSG